MNGRWRAWLLAFSLGLNGVFAGYGVTTHWPGGGKAEEHNEAALELGPDELRLSELQREKWESIRRQQDREQLRMKAASVARLDQLGALMTRPEIPAADLQAFLEDLKKSAADYVAGRLESFLEQREILDAAQEQQLREMFQKRVAGMRDWSQRRYDKCRQSMIAQYGEAFVTEALADTVPATSVKEDAE